MPLPVSTLAAVGIQVAAFLRLAMNAAANGIDVRVGNPASVDTEREQHQLNLFFYRLEPSAFQAEGHPNDPRRMRLFCLVTPFGIEEAAGADETVSAGENDLRLLGEVLRVLHEQPILPALDANGVAVRLQAVLMPMTDEQLNQVWSTQGDTAYRPSVVYEFALFPVVPSVPRQGAFRVGAVGLEARAAGNRFTQFAGVIQGPRVPLAVVDTRDPAWAPMLAWLQGDVAVRTLALDVSAPDFAGLELPLWIAGAPGAPVSLHWEQWSNGFVPVGAAIPATAHTSSIDAEHPPGAGPAFPLLLALPVQLPAGVNAAQLLLYAERDVNGIGMAPRRVRSEPLLVTLFRGAP